MKLPVLDTYAFPVTLPSNGKEITMRPYLVREEKLLLMAQESENYDDQIEAIAQIIRNCTNNQVNPRVAPYFDIEYLLLQLRARSVGEVATPIYMCHNKPNGDEIECGHRTNVPINLNEITVMGLNLSDEDFEIKLTDRYTLQLRYPTVYTIHQLVVAAIDDAKIETDTFMEAICDVFDILKDNQTGKSFAFMDYTTAEKMEFLESLSTKNYEELIVFLDKLPTVEKTLTFTCEKCKFEHKITLSGVVDFLD